MRSRVFFKTWSLKPRRSGAFMKTCLLKPTRSTEFVKICRIKPIRSRAFVKISNLKFIRSRAFVEVFQNKAIRNRAFVKTLCLKPVFLTEYQAGWNDQKLVKNTHLFCILLQVSMIVLIKILLYRYHVLYFVLFYISF